MSEPETTAEPRTWPPWPRTVVERHAAGEDVGGSVLGAWAAGQPVASLEVHVPGAEQMLRDEVLRMVDALDMVRASLAKLATDLDGEARLHGEAYASDPLLRGYAMGKSRQSGVVSTALSALANSLMIRATAKKVP